MAASKPTTKPASTPAARLGAIPESLIDHLAGKLPAFAALPLKQQAALAAYLFNHDVKRYRHSDDDTLQCLFWKERHRVFRGEWERVNESLGGWFVEKIKHRKGRAKGYLLTDTAYELLEEWAFSGYIECKLVDWLGEPVRKPRTAINTMTASGTKSRFRNSPLQAYVPVDGDSLFGLIKACHAWQQDMAAPAGYEWAFKEWNTRMASAGRRKAARRVRDVLLAASKMLHLAAASAAPGFAVPVVYTEVKSGRLYADGFTPAGCAREVKRAALRGCWEYDGANMHWQLLYKLAKRISPALELPAIEAYLTRKEWVRAGIAKDAGISIPQAKEVLLSLIFGASLNGGPETTIPSIVGQDNLPALRSAVKAICADMTRARDVVLAHYWERSRKQYRSKGLVNDAGRTLTHDDKEPGSKGGNLKAKELAHILQGLESEILRACIEHAGESIVLLQHDGFAVSDRLDMDGLRAAIEAHVGMVIDLEESQL